jgi:hypothetical protein
MKKTVISVILLGLFSNANIIAEENVNEKALNNVLEQLMKKEEKKTPKPIVVKKELPNISVISKKPENKNLINSENIIDNSNALKENYTEIVEQPDTQLLKKESIDSIKLTEKVLNQDLTVKDIHDDGRDIDYSKQNNMFLLNVPAETKIRANVDLVLPPYRETIFYNKGKLVAENPFSNSLNITYCYLVLEPSGFWRRFKSDSHKYLTVKSNVSQKKTYQSNKGDDSLVYAHETVFTFDNPHIKNLVCESTEKSLPLTIGDVNKATGNLFSFEITPMVDI